jgi:sulfite exporter TauE/SafE
LNGLLPCGLLYAAIGAAAGLGDFRSALGFMAAFAVGTLPIFGVLACSAQALLPWLPAGARRAVPAALAIVGVLLIARGVAPPSAHAAMAAHHH